MRSLSGSASSNADVVPEDSLPVCPSITGICTSLTIEFVKLEMNLLVSRVVTPTILRHLHRSLWREFPTGFEERPDDASVDPKEVVKLHRAFVAYQRDLITQAVIDQWRIRTCGGVLQVRQIGMNSTLWHHGHILDAKVFHKRVHGHEHGHWLANVAGSTTHAHIDLHPETAEKDQSFRKP